MEISAYYAEDSEKQDNMKSTWIKKYGGWILAGLIVLGVVAYYQGWIKIGGLTIGGR